MPGRGKMIQVDENQYTGVGKIYAVGDVAGGNLATIGQAQAVRAVRKMFGSGQYTLKDSGEVPQASPFLPRVGNCDWTCGSAVMLLVLGVMVWWLWMHLLFAQGQGSETLHCVSWLWTLLQRFLGILSLWKTKLIWKILKWMPFQKSWHRLWHIVHFQWESTAISCKKPFIVEDLL